MDLIIIAQIWAVVSAFTLLLVLYKDLPTILGGWYRLKDIGWLLLSSTAGPLTWVILGLAWIRQRSMVEDIEEQDAKRIRHGQRLRLGDELFKAYRIGDDVKLKLIK